MTNAVTRSGCRISFLARNVTPSFVTIPPHYVWVGLKQALHVPSGWFWVVYSIKTAGAGCRAYIRRRCLKQLSGLFKQTASVVHERSVDWVSACRSLVSQSVALATLTDTGVWRLYVPLALDCKIGMKVSGYTGTRGLRRIFYLGEETQIQIIWVPLSEATLQGGKVGSSDAHCCI